MFTNYAEVIHIRESPLEQRDLSHGASETDLYEGKVLFNLKVFRRG